MGIQDACRTHHEDLFGSLGWNVVTLSGDSVDSDKNRLYISQLRAALLKAKEEQGKAGRPMLIIADTIKGKGVDFMEYHGQKPGDYKFHGTAPTNEELARALPLIEARLNAGDTSDLPAFLKQSAISTDE